ncbi:hypothetical protein GE09DRAFT_1220477 [Coniochaeta sp. 2T2.1]|nr:hypothetical protein GE09DRAFT_1220477 [Coniochaeta sp. 2T2.1]
MSTTTTTTTTTGRTTPCPDGCYECLTDGPSFSAAAAERSWPSLADLSTELLMLMFEQLIEVDRQTATKARLVCRRFNDIATPLVYRKVVLNKNVMCKDGEIRHHQAFNNIFRYTTHLTVPSDLDPYWARRILERTQNLQEITWRYVKINQWEKWSWRPCHVLDMEIVKQNRLKLHIEGLPIDICGGDLQKLYLQSIPPSMLVSLKLGVPTPPLTTQLEALKELLTLAHNLETLHYQDRGQGTHFVFSGNERLPAFKELRLESYDWNHDAHEVAAHWDFSRLESLELISMPTFSFLNSVSFPDFAGLETLRVEDFSLHNHYRREEANELLHTLVKSHINALTTLDLRVHTSLFPIDAILAHASSIHTLRLRDHTGFSDESLRVPTLSPADLSTLATSLTHLHTLELDMDTHLVSTNAFLRSLSLFPKLTTLTLHMHTLVDPHSSPSPSSHPDNDKDKQLAYRIFYFLAQARRQQTPQMPRSWKSITINVGGWQRVMVRRLSQAWKALNRRGVFAERCFVLTRVGGEEEYRTGEEFGGGLFLGGWDGGQGGEAGEEMMMDVDVGRNY